MENKYLVLATTGDRVELCKEFIASLEYIDKDWQLVVIAQDYKDLSIFNSDDRKVKIIDNSELLGMHTAKITAVEWIASQVNNAVICFCDDDIEFTEQTNLDDVDLVFESSVGLISLNWVRSRKIQKDLKNEYKKQKIVYTGGGLICRLDIAIQLLNLGKKDYLCDNSIWSAYIYTQGYTNYRYLGSIAIHKILKPGGRKRFVVEKGVNNLEKYDNSILEFKKEKNGVSYLIPLDKDLSEKAHKLHKENAKHRRP
jgi:organic radical activating enzyme